MRSHPRCRGFNYLWSIIDRSLLEGYLLAVYDIDTGREGFELVGCRIAEHEDALEVIDGKETALGVNAFDSAVVGIYYLLGLDKV